MSRSCSRSTENRYDPRAGPQSKDTANAVSACAMGASTDCAVSAMLPLLVPVPPAAAYASATRCNTSTCDGCCDDHLKPSFIGSSGDRAR